MPASTSSRPKSKTREDKNGRKISDVLDLEEMERLMETITLSHGSATTTPPLSTGMQTPQSEGVPVSPNPQPVSGTREEEQIPEMFQLSHRRERRKEGPLDRTGSWGRSSGTTPRGQTPLDSRPATTTTMSTAKSVTTVSRSGELELQPKAKGHQIPLEIMTPLDVSGQHSFDPAPIMTDDKNGNNKNNDDKDRSHSRGDKMTLLSSIVRAPNGGNPDELQFPLGNVPHFENEDSAPSPMGSSSSGRRTRKRTAIPPATIPTGCFESIFRHSCRDNRGEVATYNVLVPPPLEVNSCIPPSGFAIESRDVVAKHACYGVKGDTLEKQRENEIEDEKPPKSASEMPYSGGVIDLKQWNPVCLQALILLVPLVFFIVTFVTQYENIMTTSSKNALTTGKLLGTLSAYLVQEQAMASYMTTFATYVVAPADQTVFFSQLSEAAKYYESSQARVNDIVAQIQVEIGKNAEDLQSILGDTRVGDFINQAQLAEVRVRALSSSNNADIMNRYENIIQTVLNFRGSFMFQESIRTTSELKQTKFIFSTAGLKLTKSLELFFDELKVELGLQCPTEESEVAYLRYFFGALRLLERTFLYPSDPTRMKVFSDMGTTYVNMLSTQFPNKAEEAVLIMLKSTFSLLNSDVSDREQALMTLETLSKLTKSTQELDEELVPHINKYRTTSDIIGVICLILLFALSCFGLLLHVALLVTQRFTMSLQTKLNRWVVDMREAVIRMHQGTVKVLKLDVDNMSSEVTTLNSKKLRLHPEERELYIGNRMTQRIEPFLPLPMVCPPSDVPQETLLHGTLFARPMLLNRKHLVGVRLHFSILAFSSSREMTLFSESASRTNMENSSRYNVSVDKLNLSKVNIEEKRQSQSEQKEQQYFEWTMYIIKFMCEVSRVYMPSSEKGAYLSQCGEDAVLWVNLCEEIDYPCVIAYLIAASVSDYCERCLIETPDIGVCFGEGVLGNITSYSPHGLGLVQDGVWTNSIIFNALGEEDLESNSDEELIAADTWKDFMAVTEGYSIPKRFRQWMKQLFGKKSLQSSVNTSDMRKNRSEHKSSLEALRNRTMDDSESDYDIPVPEELAKEDRPSENAKCLTSFTVYGEVAQELEVAVNVAHCHSQAIVANEDFLRCLLRDRNKAREVLEKLKAQQQQNPRESPPPPAEESVRRRSVAGGSSRKSASTTKQSADQRDGNAPLFSSQRDDDSRSSLSWFGWRGKDVSFKEYVTETNPSSGYFARFGPLALEVATEVTLRFTEHHDVAVPIEILEVRRRSEVMAVEEILTRKERLEKERALSHRNSATTPRKEDPLWAQLNTSYRLPQTTGNMAEGGEEPVEGFTRYNKLVDVGKPTTVQYGKVATTSKIQGDARVYYSLMLDKEEPAGRFVVSTTSSSKLAARGLFGASRIPRFAEDLAASDMWDRFMKLYIAVFFAAEERYATGLQEEEGSCRPGCRHLKKAVKEAQEALTSVVMTFPSSSFATFSALRFMDILRTVQLVSDSDYKLPRGLQMLNPYSLEALRIYEIHTLFTATAQVST